MHAAELPPEFDRYQRQLLFGSIGESGQRRLSESTVLICGCGALGSVIANTLARAGVGRLRIVDRDFVEWNNLQRQVLFDEDDARSHAPKAVAAAERLRKINSQITIEAIVADVNHRTIEKLLEGVDVIADGTDNFETRFLLNDAALCFGVPWVYGGCIGAEGQSMTIVPKRTGCLRCLIPEPPPPGTTATCDTAGILAPIVNIIASIQAAEVLKIASGNVAAIHSRLSVIDVWENRWRTLGLPSLPQPDCPACGRHDWEWLEGRRGSQIAVLCGRNAVQLTFASAQGVDLTRLATQLEGTAKVLRTPYLVRAEMGDVQITVFADGRAIIGGTNDPAEAKSLYAKYVGN